MAGGRGTVGQSGHHLVHKPKSGPRLLAWVVRHILFPMALGGWQRKEDARLHNLSHLCSSAYDVKMTHAWLSHTLNCICFAEKTLSYHTPGQARSMCHHSNRWRSESPAAQSQDRSGKWCVPPSDGTNLLWIHGWAPEACGIPQLSWKTKDILFMNTCCLLSPYHYLTPDPDHKIEKRSGNFCKHVQNTIKDHTNRPLCRLSPSGQTSSPENKFTALFLVNLKVTRALKAQPAATEAH